MHLRTEAQSLLSVCMFVCESVEWAEVAEVAVQTMFFGQYAYLNNNPKGMSQVLLFAEGHTFEFSSVLCPIVHIRLTDKQLVVVAQAKSSSIAV